MTEHLDLGRPLRSRMHHDPSSGALCDGSIRYLTMRADVLGGMLSRLSSATRRDALDALAASVEENGGKSIAIYLAKYHGDAEALLSVMVDAAADLGWGKWQFGTDRAGLPILQVSNSPFAAGQFPADMPLCAPIRGIFAALCHHLLPSQHCPDVMHKLQFHATEIHCTAERGGNSCRFALQN